MRQVAPMNTSLIIIIIIINHNSSSYSTFLSAYNKMNTGALQQSQNILKIKTWFTGTT